MNRTKGWWRSRRPTSARGASVALLPASAAKPEWTDLAALFLPVEASGEEPWVDARRLHEALGSKRDFSDWVKKRAKDCQLVENEDYGVCSPNLVSKGAQGRGGHNAKEYWLTMDAAKGFSMMERNAQGKRVSDYFSEREKQLRRSVDAVESPAPACEYKGDKFIVPLQKVKEAAAVEGTSVADAVTYLMVDDGGANSVVDAETKDGWTVLPRRGWTRVSEEIIGADAAAVIESPKPEPPAPVCALVAPAEAGENVAQTDIILASGSRILVREDVGVTVANPAGVVRGVFCGDAPAPAGTLVAAANPDCTDLAALFLPVEAGAEEPWVDARRLHEALGVGKAFGAWLPARIKLARFVEGEDFTVVSKSGNNPQGGRPTMEYWLTMDMAKHLAMLERNAQGETVRRYFIACEKELQRRQRAELVPAIELKQAKDGGTFIAGLLTEAAVKNVAAEAALKEATDRATKAEQALGDAVIQPGLAATVAAMGINLETEKHRADHWATEAKALQEKLVSMAPQLIRADHWEREALALQEKIKTMVPRLIPTDTMSVTEFVDAYSDLGLGRNQLTTFLRARGVLYTGPRKNGGVHTASPIVKTYIDNGYFVYDKSLIQRQRKGGNVDDVIYLNAHVTPKGIPWLLKEIADHELLLIHRTLMELANSDDPEIVSKYKALKRLKGKWVAELGSVPYDRLRSALTSEDAAASRQSTGSASVHEHGTL